MFKNPDTLTCMFLSDFTCPNVGKTGIKPLAAFPLTLDGVLVHHSLHPLPPPSKAFFMLS